MNPYSPEVLGLCALVASLVTIGAVAHMLRRPPRNLIPDWIWEEVENNRKVRVLCRRCARHSTIIMPVPCEGALIVREIFGQQHANCTVQPVVFSTEEVTHEPCP